MEFLLTTAYIFLFLYIILKADFFKTGLAYPRLPGIFFIVKCISGILLGLMYTHYYTNHSDADTFKFFTDSKYIADTVLSKPYDFFRMLTGFHGKDPDLLPYYLKMDSWLNNSPLYNDNRTIIRLNAIFRFFSMGYYNVHVVFLNFISFTGLFCLYKTFIAYAPSKKTELIVLIFLMPSLLFWGSGLLKDGLMISGFGFLIYSFHLILKKGISSRRILILFLALLVLAFTKIYVLALIFPGMIAWFLTRKSDSKKVAWMFVLIYALYFGIAFNLYHVSEEYNMAALLYYKQKNFVEIGLEHDATMISFPHFICSGPSIVMNSPQAFSNTFIRPFIWETHGNPMVMLSALENLLLLGMIALTLISIKTKGKRTEPLIMLSVAFVLTLFILIGLITPVLGAIVRYRIVALPSLIFIIVYYYDKEKLMQWLPFLKSKK